MIITLWDFLKSGKHHYLYDDIISLKKYSKILLSCFHFSAYSNCVNEPFCAARTIQGYMNRFGQDCTGDGNI